MRNPQAQVERPLRGGTLFSGIGSPELGAPWVDWRWCAEIDPFASAVLATRFFGRPNLGDVRSIPSTVEPVDLIVFGSPCQSFSVAGNRAGLDDPRGNLALIGLRVVERVRPRWVVFENVAGLLSSDGWRDFGTFLGALGQCGYGFSYRVLDAQFAGVPQRRRRVFVVGYLGDWRPAAAVLFEPQSLSGHPPPRRETGQGIAPLLEVGARTNSDGERDGDGIGAIGDPMFTLQAGKQHGMAAPLLPDTAGTLGAHKTGGWGADIDVTGAFISVASPTQPARSRSTALDCDGGFVAFGGGRQSGAIEVATACTTNTRIDFETETLTLAIRGRGASHDLEFRDDGVANALLTPNGGRGGIGVGAVANAMSVRRLTPRECERLQGFPDDFTLITYRGKPAADAARYRVLGNAMAVPVIRWILERVGSVNGCLSLRRV
jgi:DNA (cytosine-5)-methyltransferase 1